jgi:hypothetical protein
MKKMKNLVVRQGDVLIMSAKAVPSGLVQVPRDKDRIVLAYGEVTGHSHAIADPQAALFSSPSTTDRFLRIMAASGAALVHEEHSTILLPPGDYIVRLQREYQAPDITRTVAD